MVVEIGFGWGDKILETQVAKRAKCFLSALDSQVASRQTNKEYFCKILLCYWLFEYGQC